MMVQFKIVVGIMNGRAPIESGKVLSILIDQTRFSRDYTYVYLTINHLCSARKCHSKQVRQIFVSWSVWSSLGLFMLISHQ